MSTNSPHPNVLIILMDDLGYGDLACLGNPYTSTPNLDRLHGESARLTRYCSGPLCTPARAALMTGRHPYRTRAIDTYCGRSIIDPDERTLAHVLGDAGYRCGLFGKWHLGDTLPSRPQDMGFHETLHHTGGGLEQPANVGRSSYFDPDLIRNGKSEPSRGYCTDVFTDAAIGFVEAERNNPWFCYLATNAPHSPFMVPEKWIEPYRQQGISEKLARLYGMVTNIDANVGKILDRLEQLKLTDDTLVIFTSDHGPCPSAATEGELRFNASLRGMKGTMYEGGIRVPCFWKLPKHIAGGHDIDRLTNPIDMLPTIAGLCQAKTPEDRTIDGVDLEPLLSGSTASDAWPDRSICMQWHRGDIPEKYRNAANIHQSYKWYWPANATRPELYHVQDDPEEQQDLAEQYPDQAEEMQAEYEAWFEDVSHTRGATLKENYAPPSILIGDKREAITVLTRQDCRLYEFAREGWGDEHPGYWAVRVVRPGRYKLTVDLPRLDRSATLSLRCGHWLKDIPLLPKCASIQCEDADFVGGDQRLEALITDSRGVNYCSVFVRVEYCNDP